MTISTARTIWADAMDDISPAEFLSTRFDSEIAAGVDHIVSEYLAIRYEPNFEAAYGEVLREYGYAEPTIDELREAMTMLLTAEIAA